MPAVWPSQLTGGHMARVGGKKPAQEAGLNEEQTAFPRGGAALLSHQERKQIEQQALAAVEAEGEGLHGQGHDGVSALQRTPTGQELSKKRKHSGKAAQVIVGVFWETFASRN